MERKRKGYLLRKNASSSFQQAKTSSSKPHHQQQPSPTKELVCLCNKNGTSRTYDLQTQTVTFGEEDEEEFSAKPKKKVSRSSILKKFAASENAQKTSKNRNNSSMDQDLEFYPVDDHPSPSTFTAWDAFLAGNQAFFREPACLVPDPAFSYMDVIPEEDDEAEALLESDTDDTGSSVSTVIDRFSRTSTANSSFSERCKGSSGEITFDLEKVLSPFERLEKELDAHHPKSHSLCSMQKESPIQRGPIVVITTSSSCEDVNSEDDTSLDGEAIESSLESAKSVDQVENGTAETTPEVNHNNENIDDDDHTDHADVESAIENVAQTKSRPSIPARIKLVNGCKGPPSIKSSKTDLPKAKKSYPTPSVPPRMSKHLPARRTRSDPGSPDQPSRIPRPISSPNRPPSSIPSPKSSTKTNRNRKVGIPKKVVSKPDEDTAVDPEILSLSSESHITDKCNSGIPEETEPESEGITEVDVLLDTVGETADACHAISIHTESSKDPVEFEDQETMQPDAQVEMLQESESIPESVSPNPFKSNLTNPFCNNESRNPFTSKTNPFESTASEESTPALPSKAQMSSAFAEPPPIPERTLPISSTQREKQEKSVEIEISLVQNTVTENEVKEVEQPAQTDKPAPEPSESNNQHCTSEVTVTTNNPEENIVHETLMETSESNFEPSIPKEVSDFSPSSASNKEDEPNAAACPSAEISSTNEQEDTNSPAINQRPIEDILDALDQLVLTTPPKEMEINIDWIAPGAVNIRENVVPSTTSGDGSIDSETEGLTEDRQICIEALLKEVDECLRAVAVGEETDERIHSDIVSPADQNNLLSPGSADAPTAGSTPLHHVQEHDTLVDSQVEQSSPEMLRHQEQRLLADEQRVFFTSAYQEAFRNCPEDLEQELKHHSPGCDDSGVFLEESLASSPETQSKSAATRLQNSLQQFADEQLNMKQYSVPEGLDSDAEKSDDLGLASSSIDSADDLDGDPLPSKIGPPPSVPARQKPPPVPARKSLPKNTYSSKNSRFYSNEVITEVPNQSKTPLCKSSSSGEDSNFGEGDIYPNDDYLPNVTMRENVKNFINQQKNEQSRTSYVSTRSFHEDSLINLTRENNQESKSSFLAGTLSSSSPTKKIDLSSSINNGYASKNGQNHSGFKWKSEECLRTAAETKWCLPGRRYEKSVSVKDRIAMFSEMESSKSSEKRDLHRYGSETNIKAAMVSAESKKIDPLIENEKVENSLKDSKWHSMQSIAKKSPEKEIPYQSSTMKPAMSIPSLPMNSAPDNVVYNSYATLPVKLDVEPPKPVTSTYPETQLTNNKRYNYGLYSLKTLKNTEDLLSKKIAGSNLHSIIDNRKQSLGKLKGLVIPDKPFQPNNGKDLPTIISSDSESIKDSRRASLPITVVTACSTSMSLPRNQKLERPVMQKQTSLLEPPWKNETKTNFSNVLPKYSPAFKKRTLELPGSSLSPTPPSSITSPLSPPPSSPSSICSSNASSTLQQNVFQFSLSHSKPVQPLQPEKALMSPPSLPSDVEYEGDNSEDSSHSASPMRNGVRNSKEVKKDVKSSSSNGFGNNNLSYGQSNTFTSCAKTVTHQPLMVETLVKPPKSTDHPRAAVCISKTEIHFKSQKSTESQSPDTATKKVVESVKYVQSSQDYPTTNATVETAITSKKNGVSSSYYSSQTISSYTSVPCQNGSSHQDVSNETSDASVSVGKFRALPLTLQESQAKDYFGHNSDSRPKMENGRPPPSECDDSDDDSHSTLSHRTEDSRHMTDDCLSDATTDSFEKGRLVHADVNHLKNIVDDYASTEGYLSDASTTDVSLRRFGHRPIDYSAEEYFSDATAESPDPEWMSNNRNAPNQDMRYRNTLTQSESVRQSTESEVTDSYLQPKRLGQQRTVLKASLEPPTGSVQKFKALAEKWEQRVDVTSPPPPPPVANNATGKRDLKTNSIAAAILSTNTSAALIKSKSSLPPSLMPRTSPSESKKSASLSRSSSREPTSTQGRPKEVEDATRISSLRSETTSSSWSQQYNDSSFVDSPSRRDSKAALKEDDRSTQHRTNDIADLKKSDFTSKAVLTNGSAAKINNFADRKSEGGSWNNEPRNRRGADFSRSEWSTRPSQAPKASVSDIRKSFEKDSDQTPPIPPATKKPPLPARAPPAVPASPPVPLPRQSSVVEEDDEIRKLVEEARLQLQQEGLSGHMSVHHVLLKREGLDGGSVGITLAGGADYEVKEITVHKVISGSLADRNGLVLKGDRVMSINGRNLRGISHGEALHILKAPNPKVLLVLARNSNLVSNGPAIPSEVANAIVSETFVVELQKDATGVGFSIEGGKDSPQGDRPLLIKRVFKGGAADKEGHLSEGDEILAINDHPVTNMTRTEAWNFLKKLPEGIVRLKLKKNIPSP